MIVACRFPDLPARCSCALRGDCGMTGFGLPPRIVIIGGGFTGAAVAVHLARDSRMPLTVQIVEPRATLGGGVAYSSTDPAHRTNVDAARMSLLVEDEQHFVRWLAASGALARDLEAKLADGRIFARRSQFGTYVSAQLATAGKDSQAMVTHVHDQADAIERRDGLWRIPLASGRSLLADIVVLATSHPPPAPPAGLAETLRDLPGFVPDPWRHEALAGIGRDDRVVIMGTALSMADVVASLDRRGHRGPILAFSRRGQVSRAHADRPHVAFGEFARTPPQTALELLVRLRRTIGAAAAAGLPWQAAIDAARRDGQSIWQALPERQQRALLRHLRPFWEVHRYRMAPQIRAVLERRRAEGTLTVLAAALGPVERLERGLRCELLPRGAGAVRQVEAEAFVVTTGPAHGRLLAGNPALRSLAQQGLLQADRLGLGLMTDRSHQAIGTDGTATATLLVAGPLSRGTFGELMGLPQVATNAASVAQAILVRLDAGDDARTAGIPSITDRIGHHAVWP